MPSAGLRTYTLPPPVLVGVLGRAQRDDPRRRRDLGVRRVLADEDHVPLADAIDAPVDGDVGARWTARVYELGLGHEVADLRDPPEAAGVGEQRARLGAEPLGVRQVAGVVVSGLDAQRMARGHRREAGE